MRWVTYFPKIYNVHLTKDVGLLPFYMQKRGYQSALMTSEVGDELQALATEVRGLQVGTLKDRGKRFFLERSALNFFKTEARHIDVLNMWHLSRHTIAYGAWYKKHNPQGKLYIKLDAYNEHLRTRKKFSKNPLKQIAMAKLEKRFHRAVDLVSVENKEGVEIARSTYPEWRDKLIYLPNGCNDLYLKSKFKTAPKKERVIFSAGRVGSADKNYELLLAALPHLKLGNWKIRIAGHVSDAFKAEWEAAAAQYPEAAKNVQFLGEISDRDELYREYSRARVFFLSSRFESFGIAFAEALFFGNVLVGHRGMAAYQDLCDGGEYGTFYEDNSPESFANALSQAIAKSEEKAIVKRIRDHSAAHFSWSKWSKILADKLNDV